MTTTMTSKMISKMTSTSLPLPPTPSSSSVPPPSSSSSLSAPPTASSSSSSSSSLTTTGFSLINNTGSEIRRFLDSHRNFNSEISDWNYEKSRNKIPKSSPSTQYDSSSRKLKSDLAVSGNFVEPGESNRNILPTFVACLKSDMVFKPVGVTDLPTELSIPSLINNKSNIIYVYDRATSTEFANKMSQFKSQMATAAASATPKHSESAYINERQYSHLRKTGKPNQTPNPPQKCQSFKAQPSSAAGKSSTKSKLNPPPLPAKPDFLLPKSSAAAAYPSQTMPLPKTKKLLEKREDVDRSGKKNAGVVSGRVDPVLPLPPARTTSKLKFNRKPESSPTPGSRSKSIVTPSHGGGRNLTDSAKNNDARRASSTSNVKKSNTSVPLITITTSSPSRTSKTVSATKARDESDISQVKSSQEDPYERVGSDFFNYDDMLDSQARRLSEYMENINKKTEKNDNDDEDVDDDENNLDVEIQLDDAHELVDDVKKSIKVKTKAKVPSELYINESADRPITDKPLTYDCIAVGEEAIRVFKKISPNEPTPNYNLKRTNSGAPLATDSDLDSYCSDSEGYEPVKRTTSDGYLIGISYLLDESEKREILVKEIRIKGNLFLNKNDLVIAENVEITLNEDPANKSDSSKAKQGPCIDSLEKVFLSYDKDGNFLLIPTSAVIDYEDPTRENWFYPLPLSPKHATCYLRLENRDGCFLIYCENSKASTELDDAIYLSVLFEKDVYHYNVMRDSLGCYYLENSNRTFARLHDLVDFYQKDRGLLCTRLRRPMKESKMEIVPGHHFDKNFQLVYDEVIVSGRIIRKSNFGMISEGTYRKKKVLIEVLRKYPLSKTTQEDIDEFIDVAKLLMIVDHMNIVKIIGIVCNPPRYYIVTEYSDEENLRDRLCSNFEDFDMPTLLDICVQITRALVYLESKHFILHRRISCKSFYILPDFRVRLDDFSKARQVVDDLYHADQSEKIQIRWSAPEVLAQNLYSTKSDVWSMGVTFWELFSSGERPSKHLTSEQYICEIFRGSILSRPAPCSSHIYNVMKSCWRFKPESRPSAQEIETALNLRKRSLMEMEYQPVQLSVDPNTEKPSISSTTETKPKSEPAKTGTQSSSSEGWGFWKKSLTTTSAAAAVTTAVVSTVTTASATSTTARATSHELASPGKLKLAQLKQQKHSTSSADLSSEGKKDETMKEKKGWKIWASSSSKTSNPDIPGTLETKEFDSDRMRDF